MTFQEVKVPGDSLMYTVAPHLFASRDEWVVKKVPWQAVRDADGKIRMVVAYAPEQETLYYALLERPKKTWR